MISEKKELKRKKISIKLITVYVQKKKCKSNSITVVKDVHRRTKNPLLSPSPLSNKLPLSNEPPFSGEES